MNADLKNTILGIVPGATHLILDVRADEEGHRFVGGAAATDPEGREWDLNPFHLDRIALDRALDALIFERDLDAGEHRFAVPELGPATVYAVTCSGGNDEQLGCMCFSGLTGVYASREAARQAAFRDLIELVEADRDGSRNRYDDEPGVPTLEELEAKFPPVEDGPFTAEFRDSFRFFKVRAEATPLRGTP